MTMPGWSTLASSSRGPNPGKTPGEQTDVERSLGSMTMPTSANTTNPGPGPSSGLGLGPWASLLENSQPTTSSSESQPYCVPSLSPEVGPSSSSQPSNATSLSLTGSFQSQNQNQNQGENPGSGDPGPTATTVTYTYEGINKMGQQGLTSPFQSSRNLNKTFSLYPPSSTSSSRGAKRIPGISSPVDLTSKSKSSSSSSSSCCQGSSYHKGIICIFLLLIVAQAVILGCWIRLFDLINLSMPHTFSWLVLLSSFGSAYTFKSCNSSSSPDPVLNSPSVDCDVEHSTPYMPIVGITLTSIQMLMTLLFLSFRSCRRPFLFYLKQSVFLQGLFLLLGGTSTGVFLYRDLGNLRDWMRRELNYNWMAPTPVINSSPRWQLTQIQNECCGLYGPADWMPMSVNENQGIFRRGVSGPVFMTEGSSVLNFIPNSCCRKNPCDTMQVPKKKRQAELEHLEAHSSGIYWPKGCYSEEYSNVLFYAQFELLLMLLTFLNSIAFFSTAKRFHTSCKQSQKLEEAASHRVFIRQGTNFMVFGGQPKASGRSKSGKSKSYMIRKNGVLVEAKGALASSTGMNETQISLEILNFSRKDKINVCREMDRIVMTVTKGGCVRGKAVITALNESSLEGISIVPTAAGILNICI